MRLTLFLCGIWSAIIAAEMLFPYRDAQAQDFMRAAENCGGSCLLGIQPGITRAGDAMRQLQAHPWVSSVRQNAPGSGYAQISWDWSGLQPAGIDSTRQGRITFYWDDENVIALDDAVVETVTIYTRMRHFALQNVLGVSDGGSATFRPDGKLSYSVSYPVQGGILNLYAELACPFNALTYWDSPTRITLSIGRSDAGYVHPAQLAGICAGGRN